MSVSSPFIHRPIATSLLGGRRHARRDRCRSPRSRRSISPPFRSRPSVAFVVDDAIVMIENCFRNLEKACRRSARPSKVRGRSDSPCSRSHLA